MTAAAQSHRVEPFLLDGVAGSLFALSVAPAEPVERSVGVVYAAPFAEEANKVRRQVFLQAKMLAAKGFNVLLVDVFGTGDSSGEFAEARWEIWVEDLMRGIAWLRGSGIEQLVVWGVRCGALLAREVTDRLQDESTALLLWQPVTSGALHMQQFMRLRSVAQRLTTTAGQQPEDPRAELAREGGLEVAGYYLDCSLVSALDERTLAPVPRPVRVDWVEVVGDEQRPLSPATARAVDAWRTAGSTVNVVKVQADPFWATAEVATSEAVLGATTRMLTRSS